MAVLFSLACCAPIYDEQADKSISDLQNKIDAKIVQLISIDRLTRSQLDPNTPGNIKLKANASYTANVDFYNETDSSLTSAQMQVDRSPDLSTANIDQTFLALRGILIDSPTAGAAPSSMQAVHANQNGLSEIFLKATRTQVNANFAVLMRYEATIKAGKTPSN